MAKNSYPRLSPVYLAKRHAGAAFLLLAAGLCAGLACRVLVLPSRYSAEILAPVAVVRTGTPEDGSAENGGAETFDWARKNREWTELLRSREALGLIGSNIRHALKLAVTADGTFDGGRLPERLPALGGGESVSVLLPPGSLAGSLASRIAPSVAVTRDTIAENLDIQSLAAIASDLAPPPGLSGAEGWDFSFFREFLPSAPEDAALGGVDRNNPFLRVLFTLHRVLTGTAARGLAEARRTAAAEITARLNREARFSGGGGFGPVARREILRELAALPVLAANALYGAENWYGGEGSLWENAVRVELSGQTADSGTARVSAETLLHPVRYPRDTVFTRTPGLVASTVLASLAARERAPADAGEDAEPAAAAENGVFAGEPGIAPESISAFARAAVPEEFRKNPPSAAAAQTPFASGTESPVPAYREEIDEEANAARLEKISRLEESLRLASRDREACLRRLALAREEETRLSFEAMNSRRRADGLRARYDEASVLAANTRAPEIPEELRLLLVRRDEIARRLNELLAYCTAEHPFVVAALRELESVEATLGGYAVPDPGEDARVDAVATRAANLYVEWEGASAAADGLEERRGRQAESVLCLAEETENIEEALSQMEGELLAARREPVPMRRAEPLPEPAPEPAPRPVPAPRPLPAPVPAPAPPPEPAPVPAPGARLSFPPLPGAVPLHALRPGWEVVYALLAAGALLAALAALLREIFADRFADADGARRLTGLPVLAELPAYDPRSLRLAAAAMKGDLSPKGAFIPAPVELFEPPAEARRGRVTPLPRRRHAAVWVFGALFLLLAGALQYLSAVGVPQPAAAFRGGLPLPSGTVPAWSESRGAGAAEWGNLP